MVNVSHSRACVAVAMTAPPPLFCAPTKFPPICVRNVTLPTCVVTSAADDVTSSPGGAEHAEAMMQTIAGIRSGRLRLRFEDEPNAIDTIVRIIGRPLAML